MEKIFKFGKVDFYKTGRKINAVEIEICFENGVFAASGYIWNNIHNVII